MANLENEKVVRRYYDAFNNNDVKILDEVIAPDYQDYGHNPPGRGIQGAKEDFIGLTGAFANMNFKIEEVLSHDDRVVAIWSGSGRHAGDFLGFKPTQKSVTFNGISVYRVRDGKIVETRNGVDFLVPMVQLGLVSLPAAKAA